METIIQQVTFTIRVLLLTAVWVSRRLRILRTNIYTKVIDKDRLVAGAPQKKKTAALRKEQLFSLIGEGYVTN